MGATRRLAAIMFTDMVGYTAITQANEPAALKLLDRHNELLRPIFPRFHGHEVKTVGDSFLVEFESALDATNCAVEIQRYLQDHNLSAPDGSKIRIRIGIHLGDVIHSGQDIFGDAVNIASRIEPLAEPGGICVTEQVYSQVRNKVPNAFLKIGSRELKNVEFPTDVYKVSLPWEDRSAAGLPRTSRFGRRMAVLPFTNMSPDPVDEFFADGLTEEMITELSRISGLEVIARTTVARYKNASKGVREIGRELNVDVVLEGSVRKAANRIRITTQLVDAASEGHLWAERFDRDLTDIFAVQTEIARQVTDQLGIELGMNPASSRPPTEQLDAYFLYLKGRSLWNRRTLPAVRQALQDFEAAVAKDPDFAEAYSGIADCFLILFNNLEEVSWAEAGPRAKMAASRALTLNERLAPAHASLGLALGHDFEWSDAERELQRALELNPGYSPARLWRHLDLASLGRFDEAARELARAAQIDPLSPVILMNLGQMAAFRGQDEEALRCWDRTVDVEPGFLEFASLYKVIFFASRGRKDEALAASRAFEPIWARASMSLEEAFTWVPATVWGCVGKVEEAQQSLQRLMRVAERAYVPATGIARVFAALGERDEFFAWLARGVEDHTADPYMLRVSPLFNPFRADPRFADVLRRCRTAQ